MNRVFSLIFFKSELFFCKNSNIQFLKPVSAVKYLLFGMGIKSFLISSGYVETVGKRDVKPL